ncbi:poly [ADP-ribose] polymerase 2-like [Varroa jacobsoni]|uniref:poly [ADP-ribose] polymerase 2-like n=1 Tax=Varroa jacobsoni TaxID=62625 RepID=UPI000BF91490|nr:poly [ADP-ribose] polymerase 2-like [Varroa jacobsoni]
MNSQKSQPSHGKEMSTNASNLMAIEVYRPLTMRQWFQVDPLVNTVKDKTISGVRCEIAEAVALPDGHQVVWRISGVSQCAENARDLESARMNNVHQVNLGTLKVNPVKVTSVPNRIVTRTVINVLPLPLLDLERVDDQPQYKPRANPKYLKKGQSPCPSSTSKHESGIVKKDNFKKTIVANIKSADELKETEIVLRPPAHIADDTNTNQGSLGEDKCFVWVKKEPIYDDDETVDEQRFSTPATNVIVKQETVDQNNEDNGNNLKTICRRHRRNSNRLRESDDVATLSNRKRRPKREILRSEKRLKEEPIHATDPSTTRRSIDTECVDLQGQASIYVEKGDVYDVMLNQTNVEFNNNKYYLLQLAKANNRNQYYVWFRWGRVGKKGRNNLIPCADDLDKAKGIFKQKFFDKTCNEFDERHGFVKVKGKYDLVQVCADETDPQALKKEVEKITATQREEQPSCLDFDLKSFVELIFNVKKMEVVLKELKFDSQKTPLGNLTKHQIAAGYAALKVIEDCVTNGIRGTRLNQACNDFYTRIPHDFGMRVPPLIRSYEEIRQKVELLEALTDVQFAIELLRRKISADNMHIIDRHYISLGARLTKVSTAELRLINKYLQVTHAPTHNEYTMCIQDAFSISKPDEIKRFNSRIPNRMLLWHGSRLSNWASIISQGLRIAPPEAPVTGYMFGKGVYFADSSSKSANYCFPSRAHNEGILLLSEVALGEVNELYEANYEASELPIGKHSVKGMGYMVPRETSFIEIPSLDDKHPVTVPCGQLHDISNMKKRGSRNISYILNYNEYVVYDVSQIKMRYLLRIKFAFD